MRRPRQDLILLTLIVSAAIHVGLMFAARPWVMTRVAEGVARPAHRGPMRVVKPTERPEAVALEALDDVEALQSAPKAEATASPVALGDSPLPLPTAETPAAVTISESQMPALEERAKLPEVTPAAVEVPDVVRASAGVTEFSAPRLGEALSVASAPPSGGELAVAGTAFAAPAALPEPVQPAAVATIARSETPRAAFTPPAEVMERVDAAVVAAEKEAVRALVDVPNARDLASVVSLSLARAATPSWTYFRLTLRPLPTLATVPKDVVILIDASGSIGKDRMGSIRGAAKRILRSASNTGDRFNLVAFRDRYSYAFRTWQTCNAQSFDAADRWLNNVAPFGRTDVFATISSVLTLPRDPKRPLIALVVTDGEANAGVSGTAEILSRFTALNDGLVSVYMYGVKSSANRELIDVLTHGNRGECLIFDGWRWNAGEGIEPLSTRFRDPVVSDLRLVFASTTPAETYPRLLKNLCRGETVEVVGRVPSATKTLAFSLKGLNGATSYEGFFRLPLAVATDDPSLARAWQREKTLDLKLNQTGKDK